MSSVTEAEAAASRRARYRWPLPRRLVLVLLLLNLFLGLAAYFVEGAGWPLVERVARGKVERAIGPGSWQVRVGLTSWWDLLSGHVGLVDLAGEGVRLKNGLPVTRMTAKVWDMTVEGDYMTKLGSITYDVHVSEPDLNVYLRKKSGGRLRPVLSASLREGEMEVIARDRFTGIGLPFKVKGTMRVRDGTQLDFILDEASVANYDVDTIADLLVRYQVNPVVDLRELPFGLHIERFDLHAGVVDIRGTAAPPLPFLLKRDRLDPSPSPIP